MVEHWFRTDNCFSIPDEDVWYQLKELLNITINDFDESNRCYFEEGIAPTITSASADEKIIVGAAMRGRYKDDGKIEQQLELRDDGVSNALTTVQKDSLIVENFQKPPMN